MTKINEKVRGLVTKQEIKNAYNFRKAHLDLYGQYISWLELVNTRNYFSIVCSIFLILSRLKIIFL